MNPQSIQVLVQLAYAAQQNGIIALKDTKLVLDAVEDAEAFLASLQEKGIESPKDK